MAQKQIASIVEWQVQESRLVKFFYLFIIFPERCRLESLQSNFNRNLRFYSL